jgi:membrane carboxypeptidase/penicillin-binding protein PbpC
VWRTAKQLGLDSLTIPKGEAALQLPLKGGAVSLLDTTHVYGAFSRQGVLAGQTDGLQTESSRDPALLPVSILKVEEVGGQVWFEMEKPQTRPVISAQLAYLMTHVLSDESARWPSLGHPNPLEVGRPAGAKIGTSETGQDAWTVGFTPQISVGVWTGPLIQGEENEVPPEVPAGLWHAILQYATRDLPPEGWDRPPGVSPREVCDPSGMLPTPECPSLVTEAYLDGNEPTQSDTLYQKLQINRETGRLATVFTPPELIVERVYLLVPPEAESWADEAGLPTPPDSYDLLYAPASFSDTVQITAPGMFTYVGGLLPIRGNAAGPGFDFYRLQVGKGLNPQTWTQIGTDTDQPVRDGELGDWDTDGLSGLYALRLLVIRTDQRVDTATVQVTVDNQPPEADILYPDEGQAFTYPQENMVTFQMRVGDDLALDRVEVYLDDRPLSTLTSPPFAVPWHLRLGEHKLLIRAFDRAGNSSEASTQFSVHR